MNKTKLGFNIIGAVSGTAVYIVLYLGKKFVENFYLHHAAIETVLADLAVKCTTSSFKGIVSVVVSVVLTVLLEKALKKNRISI